MPSLTSKDPFNVLQCLPPCLWDAEEDEDDADGQNAREKPEDAVGAQEELENSNYSLKSIKLRPNVIWLFTYDLILYEYVQHYLREKM